MTMLFVLWHIRTFDNGGTDAHKLIGIYSTAARAAQARQRMAALPGFRDDLKGFEVHQYQLDSDGWTGGFL